MHIEPLLKLGDLPIQDFLNQYWQQKHLYSPQSLSDYLPNLDIDDLAGLALEHEVESRLIRSEENRWELDHGPFTEEQLTHLPDSNWTLLIQAADIWIPEISQFLDLFRFLPSWRLDDIMISYAADGGGVGPHFDFYDVFLIQAKGSRTWYLGPECNDQTPRVQDSPLNQIAPFEPEHTFETKPGDVLYIPAGKAHWGIANGDDCMTFSVGFRAPSDREILSNFADFIADDLPGSNRYRDSSPKAADNPGKIDDSVIEALRHKIQHLINSPTALASWFGREMTEGKYSEIQPEEFFELPNVQVQELNEFLAQNPLEVFSASRLAYRECKDATTLFIDGEEYKTTALAAETLCKKRYFEPGELQILIESEQPNDSKELLLSLVNRGILLVAQNELNE